MGANGSHANGNLESEEGRSWKEISVIGEVHILQLKNPANKKIPIKLPEESHTPNRIYAIFMKDGSDVKGIAKYGPNGKKLWEIHTADHENLGPHYHPWENGRPKKSLTQRVKKRRRHILLTNTKGLC